MPNEKKVALITGAASGIGRATAEAFVAGGYATALLDREETAGHAVEAELRGSGGECTFFSCDITDDASVKRAVDATVHIYGRLDAAFNAAGISGESGKATADGTMDNWDRVIAIDLTGLWSCMRYEIPHMLASGGGSLVNCASVAGLIGAAYVSAYTAAKHGVVGLTKAAALEYGRQGIRINAVCPGTIDTPMFRATFTQEIIDMIIADSPVGRLAQPSEIADVVFWLCDGSPAFLTGQAIAVDGGITAR